MKRQFYVCLFFLYAVSLPSIAMAQSVSGQPVMPSRPITVSEARALPHNSFVIITGNIINTLPGGKNYTFRDASGEIIVEIGLKHWRGLTVGVSDSVEIFGEVKMSRGQVMIEVQAIAGSTRPHTRPGQPVFIPTVVLQSEARALPHDSFVILTGNIVSALPGGKNYVFRDTSGEILIEIDFKYWRGLSIDVSDNVILYGEVKNNKGLVHIKVRAINKI